MGGGQIQYGPPTKLLEGPWPPCPPPLSRPPWMKASNRGRNVKILGNNFGCLLNLTNKTHKCLRCLYTSFLLFFRWPSVGLLQCSLYVYLCQAEIMDSRNFISISMMDSDRFVLSFFLSFIQSVCAVCSSRRVSRRLNYFSAGL